MGKLQETRVIECVAIRSQLRSMGAMADETVAQKIISACKHFVTDGTSYTLKCSLGGRTNIIVTLSNTQKSGLTIEVPKL
jgi:hypothetical protein